MTHTDMTEPKMHRYTLLLFVIFFILGFLFRSCVCLFIHEESEVPSEVPSDNLPPVVEELPEVEDSVEDFDIEETEEPETLVEEIEPEDKFVSYYTYTEDELDLLARLINSEGGIESYSTKLKIGSVVMNRVESTEFPNTIREVIYQDNQFSVTHLKVDGVFMIDQPADEDSKKAAKEVLDYGSILPPDVQVFYANGKCKGNWVTTRAIYDICDGTVFAYIYSKY